MDNLVDATRLTFGPDRRYLLLWLPAAVIGAGLAVVSDDPVTRFFWMVVAAVALLFALGDVLFAPRLTVSADGIRVHGPFDRAAMAWTDIDSVRAGVSVRHGLRSPTLEISAGEHLVVLGRRDLAAEPDAVATAIEWFRGSGQ